MAKERKQLPPGDDRILDFFHVSSETPPNPRTKADQDLRDRLSRIFKRQKCWHEMADDRRESVLCSLVFWAGQYTDRPEFSCRRAVVNTLKAIQRDAERLRDRLTRLHDDAHVYLIRARQENGIESCISFDEFMRALPAFVRLAGYAKDTAEREAPARGWGNEEALILNYAASFREAGLPVEFHYHPEALYDSDPFGYHSSFTLAVFTAMKYARMRPKSPEAVRKRIERTLMTPA